MEKRIKLREVCELVRVPYGRMCWRAQRGDLPYVYRRVEPNGAYFVEEPILKAVTGYCWADILELRKRKKEAAEQNDTSGT